MLPGQTRAQTTVTSSVQQSDFNGDTYGPPPPALGGATAPINPDGSTAIPAAPFTYAVATVSQFQSITSISITLTIFDGKTGPGENEVGELTLGLDDIDTGIPLNGFFAGMETGPLTITGTPSAASAAAILAALQDGQVNARIFDSGDTVLVGAENLAIPATLVNSTPINTTLAITGVVPEPSTYALLALGGLTVCLGAARRRSRHGVAA